MMNNYVQNRILSSKKFNCSDIQRVSRMYIGGELSLPDEKIFVDHVRHCESCMDDLKSYFMFSSAFQYLNEKDNLIDYSNIEDMISASERKIAYSKQKYKWLFIFCASVIIGVVLFTLMVLNSDYLFMK